MEKTRKTPVEALDDDELFKLLSTGTATPEDCLFAARWIRILTSMLTDGQNQRMRDGYDIGDEVEAGHRGMLLAALGNSVSDRIIKLAESLTMTMPPAERMKISLEIGLLVELYPKGQVL